MTLVNENKAVGSTETSSEGGSGTSSTEQGVHEFSYLASGSRDKTVKLWDALKGDCLGTFNIHENWVRGVVFHPSCKYIISCSDDRSIKVLDIKESRCVRSITDAHSHFVTCIALAPHIPSNPQSLYRVVVSGSVDKDVNVWGCS